MDHSIKVFWLLSVLSLALPCSADSSQYYIIMFSISGGIALCIICIIVPLVTVCIIGNANKRRLIRNGQPYGPWYNHIRTGPNALVGQAVVTSNPAAMPYNTTGYMQSTTGYTQQPFGTTAYTQQQPFGTTGYMQQPSGTSVYTAPNAYNYSTGYNNNQMTYTGV